MTGHDEFAIVIPAFNAEKHLARTLQSALSSGSGLAAIFVVDDGSTDDTAAIAAEFQAEFPRVTLIRQANGGVSLARNAGLARVETDYVCFLDADDMLRPGALDLLRHRLRDRPDAAASFGRLAYIDVASNRHTLTVRPKPFRSTIRLSDLLSSNFIDTPGAVLFRTGMVREAGGFMSDLAMAEDWEMYVRVSLHGPFIASADTVLDYRLHPVSTMRRESLGIQDFEPALREVFGDAARYAGRVDPEGLRDCELRVRASILRVLGQSSTRIGRSLRLLAGLGRLAVKSRFDRSVVMLVIGATLRVIRQCVLREGRARYGACP